MKRRNMILAPRSRLLSTRRVIIKRGTVRTMYRKLRIKLKYLHIKFVCIYNQRVGTVHAVEILG